jgi:hypothetical protein
MPGIVIHILLESLFTSPRTQYSHAPEYAMGLEVHVKDEARFPESGPFSPLTMPSPLPLHFYSSWCNFL